MEIEAIWRAVARQHLGSGAAAQLEVKPLGGQFDRCWRLQAACGRWFAKSASAEHVKRFAAEADGLQALANCPELVVPEVIGYGVVEGVAYLLLSWLELKPLTPDASEQAARAVAALHAFDVPVPDRFGWHRDNFIGATPQKNGWEVNWAHFVVEKRLRPQLNWAVERGFSREAARRLEAAFAAIPALFLDHTPRPALLHGDLWYGNLALTSEGRVALFDPAVHQGDPEAELAMMELFGGFPPAFYAAYRRFAGISSGYERRKPLYQLYHVLNHFNLFGQSYAREAERLIGRIAAAVS